MRQKQDPHSSSHLFSCPLIACGYYPRVKKAQVRADWIPQMPSSKCVCVCVCVCTHICIQLVAHGEGVLTVSIMCGECCLIPEKHLLLLYDYTKAFNCRSQKTVENSSRDGSTKPPYLPPENAVCRSRSNS